MHILQKHILDSLRQSRQLRYSEMQPDYIESSHFKYHLNQLLKDSLVEQKSRGIYELTVKGQATVDTLSRGKTNPHKTPKVITYTLLTHQSTYYLQRKDKQPYLNLVNMIGGKMHTGETSQEAAIREVHEKTSLQIEQPTLEGIAEIIIKDDEQRLLSHVIAYIYSAALPVQPAAQHNLEAIHRDDLQQHTGLAPDALALIQAIEQHTSPWTIQKTFIFHT